MTNVAVLALSGPGYYKDHEFAQRQTWGTSEARQHLPTYWVKGAGITSPITGDHDTGDITVPVSEIFENILDKTVIATQWLLQNLDFDFLLRTNTSTYLVPSLVNRVVSNLPTTGYYGGPTGTWGKPGDTAAWRFVSGSAMLLSRDCAHIIAEMNPDRFRGLIDDVAIGCEFAERGVLPQTGIERLDLTSYEPFEPKPNIRVKSNNTKITTRRMHEVHRLLNMPPDAVAGELDRCTRREKLRWMRDRPWDLGRPASIWSESGRGRLGRIRRTEEFLRLPNQ